MVRICGHHVGASSALLLLTEFLACFAGLELLPLVASDTGQIGDPALRTAVNALLAAVTCITLGTLGLYDPEARFRPSRLALGLAVAPVAAAALASLVMTLPGEPQGGLSHRGFLCVASTGVVAIFVARLLFFVAMRVGLFQYRVALFEAPGAGPSQFPLGEATRLFADDVRIAMVTQASAARPATNELADRIRARRIQAVVAADPGTLPATLRADFERRGIAVYTRTEFRERRLSCVDLASLPADDAEAFSRVQDLWWQRAVRRTADVALSLAILVLTLPLTILAAVAIKLDSPGPVFYRQERVGKHGRVFTIVKFRSMRVDAERDGIRWATVGDARVTGVGRWLRLTRIDEIPQILNVLRGDMAFVGPRPERPGFVEHLSQEIPHYDLRHAVKPGITGWAQVNLPYGASVDDARSKLAYDLYYINRRSLFLDFLIVLATVRVVLFREGAR